MGSAVEAATAREIGTSSQSGPPMTIRSQVSRSVAVRNSSCSIRRKSSTRSGSPSTDRRYSSMPFPSYMPEGSASARPTAMSMTDVERTWPTMFRASPSIFSGISAPARANSTMFGRISVLRSTSLKGVGTCWLTTRIISSGVTPFAVSAATNEPALVPTYTSNWFTVRLTASRSSARRAPISYTPPVNPPPPSTSAVRERRGRGRLGFPTVLRSFGDGFSSRTTSPIRHQYDRSGVLATVFCALDATNRSPRRGPARAGAGGSLSSGQGADGEAAHEPDEARGRLRERLRGGRERHRPAAGLPLARAHLPHPGVEYQALHHHRRAGPLRNRWNARHRGARPRRARPRGDLPRQPLPPRRR